MKRIRVAALLCLVASATALAQPVDIPLRNWTVPPYTASSSGGYTTMVDATPPRLFIGLPVCRLLDTRPPANNPLDGDGAYAADAIRTYDVDGACGIPAGAEAVSLNVTVTNTGNHPFGHVKIWPGNQIEPNVSTLNWATGGVTVANAAIVALSPTGTFSVKSGNAGSDVIIDVNGYFSDVLGTPANTLLLINNSTGATAFFLNESTTCSGDCGVAAEVSSGHAISGYAQRTTGEHYGVYGFTASDDLLAAGVTGRALEASANGGWFTNAAILEDVFLATEFEKVAYSLLGTARVEAGSLVITG